MLAAISALIGPVSAILDKVIPDKDLREKLSHEIATMADKQMSAQIEVNKVEAAPKSLFVAGWRPAIGWICATGLSFPFFINPVLQWLTDKAGPELPLDVLMELVLAMLGLGALRTVEKMGGKAK